MRVSSSGSLWMLLKAKNVIPRHHQADTRWPRQQLVCKLNSAANSGIAPQGKDGVLNSDCWDGRARQVGEDGACPVEISAATQPSL